MCKYRGHHSYCCYPNLQQKDVLTELHSFVATVPRPVGADETKYTLKFLEACNLMFENGFLSHDRVSISNKQVMANIDKGYEFFCNWLDGIYKGGKQHFT